MTPIIVMQSKWSDYGFVPLYLFLGGLAAGLFIVAVCADFAQAKSKGYATVAKLAAYTAIPAWALAGLFIAIHLGRPWRGVFFPWYFSNYGSWMVFGGWALLLSGPFIVVYAALWYFGIYPKVRRVIGIIGIPFAIWFAINTAMLLSGSQTVPFWPRSVLPVLFVNSGVLTGVAVAGLLLLLTYRYLPAVAELKQSMGQIILAGTVAVLVFELIEILILAFFLNYLSALAATPSRMGVNMSAVVFDYLVRGPLAVWFWVGLVGAGILIPLVLGVVELIVRRWEEQLAGVKFALLIVGGLLLRFIIVWGGEVKPIMPPLSGLLNPALFG
ncbi:MAG: polysulfide reductase NrfD [Candidatus Lambdaproteobacteria bacterium]|nr:polysulfide reductase NrfD [Candidatus Lambdaproteobacteria bacterium]